MGSYVTLSCEIYLVHFMFVLARITDFTFHQTAADITLYHISQNTLLFSHSLPMSNVQEK